jgi:dihydrofolate reductase
MRKLIAAINMTIDGFCDHTAGIADDELHNHYTELIRNAGALVYGRITYQLMESYWPLLVKNPTGDKSMDDFAMAIEDTPKIVFSRTLNTPEWKNVKLAQRSVEEEVSALKQEPGQDILVGSPSLIVQCMKLNLIDEFQLCVHPVVLGSGLPLFQNVNETNMIRLPKTKTFSSGAIILYYQSRKNELN